MFSKDVVKMPQNKSYEDTINETPEMSITVPKHNDIVIHGKANTNIGENRKIETPLDCNNKDYLEAINKLSETSYLANSFDVWCYGIVQVIGGIFCTWNTNLTSGFGTYFIGIVIMGLAYIVLIVDIAEIGSAYGDFAGGCHGIVRVVLGFYPGFIVGYLQLVEFIVYASSAILYVGSTICSLANINQYYQPFFWLIQYGIMLYFSMKHSSKSTWLLVQMLAIFSVLAILVYCFGSLKWVNLSKYGTLDDDIQPAHGLWFSGGIVGFIGCLSFTTYGFGGIESLTLMLPNMKEPQKNFQYGAISSVVTLLVLNLLLLIVMSALPPGLYYTSQQLYPMNVGFDLIFQWPNVISSLIVIPPTFAMAFGFFIPYGKLLLCLANSNLTPTIIRFKDKNDISKALCFCSFIGFLLCIIGLFFPNIDVLLNNVSILCGYITYFGILLSHLKIVTTYKDVSREFRSPFGIIGTIYSLIIFALGTVCSIGFLGDNHVTIISTVGFISIISIYYFKVITKSQKLSKEELKVHVVNMNYNKHRNLKRYLHKGIAVHPTKEQIRRLSSSLNQHQIHLNSNIPSRNNSINNNHLPPSYNNSQISG